jgi:hypothetical protein
MQRRRWLIAGLLFLLTFLCGHLTPAQAGEVGRPKVTAVVENTGPLTGGGKVTVLGKNFTAASTVTFGKAKATKVKYVSRTKLVVTAPKRPAGSPAQTVDVRVKTAAGTSAKVGADKFSFLAAPNIQSATPARSPVVGATRVVLQGTGFRNVSAVTFGGVPGTGLHVSSTTQVEVTAPAHSAGSTALQLVTPHGKATAAFTYDPQPNLASLTPTSGPLVGGNVLTLTGTGLADTRYVTVGSTQLDPLSVSDTAVTVQLPAHAAGALLVSATTWGGTTASQIYTYAPPAVSGLSPSHGSQRGGTVVAISGSGFSGATAVTFGGVAAASFTVNSDTSITATTPSHNGVLSVDTRVTVPGGLSATGPSDTFAYGIVDFTIPAGTGAGEWNSIGSPVRAWTGDTLRVFNADSSWHVLHTAGSPGAHWADPGLAPGATLDWPMPNTSTTSSPTYDHLYSTSSRFYIVVETPS